MEVLVESDGHLPSEILPVMSPEELKEINGEIQASEIENPAIQIPLVYFSATYLNTIYGIRHEIVNIVGIDESIVRSKIDEMCSLENRLEMSHGESLDKVDSLKMWMQKEAYSDLKFLQDGRNPRGFKAPVH
jgi:hypothetical protein